MQFFIIVLSVYDHPEIEAPFGVLGSKPDELGT
jgi:hypothetical protein